MVKNNGWKNVENILISLMEYFDFILATIEESKNISSFSIKEFYGLFEII